MPTKLDVRMKEYEELYQVHLNPKRAVIIRLDGRSFGNFTRGFKRPFDSDFINLMNLATIELAKEISGFRVAYLQSDEITILFDALSSEKSELWFGGRTDKILSVCAGLFSAHLTKFYQIHLLNKAIENSITDGTMLRFQLSSAKTPCVDCRVFQIPEYKIIDGVKYPIDQTIEVFNAFLFRYRDCQKNAISMFAQSLFSQKQLHGKNTAQMIEMMQDEKGFNYASQDDALKFGRFIRKVQVNKGTELEPIVRTEFKIESFQLHTEKQRFFDIIKAEK